MSDDTEITHSDHPLSAERVAAAKAWLLRRAVKSDEEWTLLAALDLVGAVRRAKEMGLLSDAIANQPDWAEVEVAVLREIARMVPDE